MLLSLLQPTASWGPALPENFRKYSTDRSLHPELAGAALGDDDVFGTDDSELKELRTPVVHFIDEKTPMAADVGGGGDGSGVPQEGRGKEAGMVGGDGGGDGPEVSGRHDD